VEAGNRARVLGWEPWDRVTSLERLWSHPVDAKCDDDWFLILILGLKPPRSTHLWASGGEHHSCPLTAANSRGRLVRHRKNEQQSFPLLCKLLHCSEDQ
jgi:hypothetical protein